ncbi:MAG: enoyl-CoA hydratase/isomerase family protein [Halieaceae bacterium]|jgi:enoyl-CoA hydratase/carnithine racemase|nr:enoyl-CoA hydratase/isomerase family protein [Halieaceae bacterium]
MGTESWQYLDVERNQRTMTVRFDSGSPVNALNHAVMAELTSLAESLAGDDSLSCVVLTGKADIFSAGMDLKDPALADMAALSIAEKRVALKAGPRLCAAWEAIEPVTIAAIEGHCVGGGMALAVSCDWRVAADNASLLVPELRLGMNMSWQSVPRFVNLIGPAKTKQLLLLAQAVDAETALHWGLLDYIAPAGEALGRAEELAAALAGMPPVPLRMAKQAINRSANALNDATSFMDLDQFLLTQGMDDAAEARRAFFEKRAPNFSGD